MASVSLLLVSNFTDSLYYTTCNLSQKAWGEFTKNGLHQLTTMNCLSLASTICCVSRSDWGGDYQDTLLIELMLGFISISRGFTRVYNYFTNILAQT